MLTANEKHAAYMRQWRADHPQEARAVKQRYIEKKSQDPDWVETERERHRVVQEQWRKANPEKRSAIARKAELLKRHSMTVERYDALVDEQSGVCALCEQPPRGKRRLVVDHDHSCCPGNSSCGNCVRGLLCDACNRGLGMLGDDLESLQLAVAYLERKWVPA